MSTRGRLTVQEAESRSSRTISQGRRNQRSVEKHGEDVQLKQSVLDKTYNRRSQVERTNEAVKDCGLGRAASRGRVHARAQVFLALCLRLVVAITNYEREDNPGRSSVT